MNAPSWFIRTLKCLMPRVAVVEVSGTEHLDTSKGQIIVANHVGWADPLWMGYAVYPIFLRQMAKRELFATPFMRWFVSAGGGFPVDRGHTSPSTIKQTITLLENGETVLIFPEGTRSHGQNNAKRGAATIALHAKVNIIPAHYEGPEAISVKHFFRRPNIRITFGTPITVPALEIIDKTAALDLTQQIDAALKRLKDQTLQKREASIQTQSLQQP